MNYRDLVSSPRRFPLTAPALVQILQKRFPGGGGAVRAGEWEWKRGARLLGTPQDVELTSLNDRPRRTTRQV